MIKPNQYLLDAVVIQACYDYQQALIKNNEREIKKLEQFFIDGFYLYSDLDGQMIMNKIRKKVDNNATPISQVRQYTMNYYKGD